MRSTKILQEEKGLFSEILSNSGANCSQFSLAWPLLCTTIPAVWGIPARDLHLHAICSMDGSACCHANGVWTTSKAEAVAPAYAEGMLIALQLDDDARACAKWQTGTLHAQAFCQGRAFTAHAVPRYRR